MSPTNGARSKLAMAGFQPARFLACKSAGTGDQGLFPGYTDHYVAPKGFVRLNETASQRMPAPLGFVEPHAPLLRLPPEGQLLYKVMTAENLLRSIEGGYLHFNRVDSYTDLLNGDPHDGEQPPGDRSGNEMSRFARAPNFTGADYYDRCRARTYACCFSLENSEYIWANYGKGGAKGNVGVVFDFAKMRATINRGLQPGNAALFYSGIECRQIFSVNYGVIDYVDWSRHQANEERLPNPILYTYLKDRDRYAEERELRISLSAIGVGHFAQNDGSLIDFPPSLQLPFDFLAAFRDGTILQVLHGGDRDLDYLHAGLRALGGEIQEGAPAGSDPPGS